MNTFDTFIEGALLIIAVVVGVVLVTSCTLSKPSVVTEDTLPDNLTRRLEQLENDVYNLKERQAELANICRGAK